MLKIKLSEQIKRFIKTLFKYFFSKIKAVIYKMSEKLIINEAMLTVT